MTSLQKKPDGRGPSPYLGVVGAWALAFGCAVGWGSFVMPGNTFLPIAGPVGTALGLGLGAVIMMVIGKNYHYLMNRFPDNGGTYTYTKECFGADHGFVSAWFLILTYAAIIWANATALPLIARTLLGSTFQFGFDYEIAGFHIYFGEILLAVLALVIGALLCLRRRAAAMMQIIMAVLLFGGIVVVFVVATGSPTMQTVGFDPVFAPRQSVLGGVFTIFALAPWAYVGFESISHSAAESKFSMKRVFAIIVTALVAAGIAYALLGLMAATVVPEGYANWSQYLENLDDCSGIMSVPVFYAAYTVLGDAGSTILGIAALCGIFTGLIGNYIALSRLLQTLAKDGMMVGSFAKLDKNEAPRRAILAIMCVSIILPFFGRAAISWIVDVTTVGATIVYAFASASAIKTARMAGDRGARIWGIAGLIVSVLFALEFLIPNLTSVKTLATESYLILATWGILGFLYFRQIMRRDTEHRYARSIVAWVILLGLIIFTSSVWMRQTTESVIEGSAAPIEQYYKDKQTGFAIVDPLDDPDVDDAYVKETLSSIDDFLGIGIVVQVGLIMVALIVMFDINAQMQRRHREIEVQKRLAEESSKAKTSFLSNMSHEIRTPMNAIIGLNNIALRDPDLSPTTREHLEKIGVSAQHLLDLINDILDMSRIEAGRIVLKNEEFKLKEILDQVNIMIQGQCTDKGLDYHTHIVGDVDAYYCGDGMRLMQVLINLLGNAVKFTEAPGDVTLTVEQIAESEDTRTLRFVMQDTGVGMDADFIPTIFEAFSQEESKVNRYGGTGLGMAITKNLVEMMNGEIVVESERGVGSTFTVTVDLGASERADSLGDEVGAFGADGGLELEIDLAGRRVLMAEDVEQNAEILADLLDLEDIESEHAENGQLAVEMFLSKPAGYYDAILMDVRMPVMDGLTAARTIRDADHPDAKYIPIIAMTANVFDEDVERSLAAGMNAHLSKPVEPDRLYEAMAKFIAAREEAGR